jgi:carboxyl-terminal processing protease
MKQNKIRVWLPLLFGLVMASGILTGFQLAGSSGRSRGSDFAERSSVQQVLDLLQYKYVDSVKLDSVQQSAINAMVEHLDPHTTYIPRQELAEVNADLQGAFSGIGVEYQMINDTMNIVYVVEKGPSEKAGLQAGDQIIKVYEKPIAGQKLSGQDLRKLLRGENKSKVEITYLRNGTSHTASITRGNIPLPSVDAWYMVSKDVGYIRLNKFSETTYREFMDAATSLQAKGMKKLILDLRGNSGGILGEATNIVDELLEDGLPIVSTKGLHVKNKTVTSSKPGILEEAPIVILIDDFSASASEVLAGALQDNDRGTIVGRRSFGKGLVQEQYDLADGGALRITVARYYTPSGRSIQKPFNGNREEYMEEIISRHDGSDSSKTETKEIFTTRKGKKVYGGGGITPDVIIPIDSTRISRETLPLFSNNSIGDFSFELFKSNQKAIRAFATVADFDKGFALPAGTFESYLQYAAKDSIRIPAKIPPATQQELMLRIKANVARYVWRTTGLVQILHPTDRYIQQALQILNK